MVDRIKCGTKIKATHRKDTDLHGYSLLSEWLLLLEGVPYRRTGSQAIS